MNDDELLAHEADNCQRYVLLKLADRAEETGDRVRSAGYRWMAGGCRWPDHDKSWSWSYCGDSAGRWCWELPGRQMGDETYPTIHEALAAGALAVGNWLPGEKAEKTVTEIQG